VSNIANLNLYITYFMKPIFSRNEDIDRMSFLNWRIESYTDFDNLRNIADGYFLSATELIANCLANNNDKRADILIFPILTNANHAIELYLKALTWMFNSLLKNDKRAEGSHNIKQIHESLIPKIKEFDSDLVGHFNILNKNLKSYIKELYERIEATSTMDKLDFSRYPYDKSYQNHFYVDSNGPIEIDLDNLQERLKIIASKLDEFYTYVYYEIFIPEEEE